ncbi:hypothetical protein ZWY2020_050565 [Hordeum vulgare]|nr:hypothetical protein ZWY2020_050565 [Hordeum vulgare]
MAGGGRGRGGGWSFLPAELIEEISDRLQADVDQIHIHQVCSHWRASTAPLAACRPWIVAAHDQRHRNAVNPDCDHSFSFWLPRGGKRMHSRALAPAGLPYCCGTPRGWLALTDDLRSPTRLILWEPLSQAEIPLPPLPSIVQLFLTGDPLASPSPAGWMAIASQKNPGWQIGHTLFWRPGDAAWTIRLDYPIGRIEGAAFHQGRLYISTRLSMKLSIFDLQQHPLKRLRLIPLFTPLRTRYPRRLPGDPVPHVVACNNQLLLVMVYRGQGRPGPVILVEVHHPDWAAERLDFGGEKVTDLGDYSLFLGRGDSLALSAKEFPAIRRNCVYFVEHDTGKHDQWVIVFDLGSNAIERIPHPQEHMEGGSKNSGWLGYSWFCPRRPFVEAL